MHLVLCGLSYRGWLQSQIKLFKGLFIVLYALTFFFDDFGPNLTTFGAYHDDHPLHTCCRSSLVTQLHAWPVVLFVQSSRPPFTRRRCAPPAMASPPPSAR